LATKALLNRLNQIQRDIKTMATLSSLPLEPLDAILRYIDIETLLLPQRVSYTWQNTITSSPQLQETLYTCSWKGNKLHHFGPAKDKTNKTTKTNTAKTTSTPTT
jgi:hypothetical protein